MSLPVVSSAQETQGDSFWNKRLLERIQVNACLQGGYTYTSFDGNKSNTFEMKRTLLIAKARITDRWSFQFMHDFNGQVQEYYTDYRVTENKALTVRAGQFKNAFSMENPVAPFHSELVDITSQAATFLAGGGSDPLFGIQYGRDLGIGIYGELFNSHLLYDIQVMNGRGVNQKDLDNKKDLIVKLDYRPHPLFRVVASAQKGYGTSLVQSSVYIPNNSISFGETYRRDRWSLGAEFKTGNSDYYKNRYFSVRGEVLGGRNKDINSWGGYITSTVPLYGQLDWVGTIDYFDYAVDFDRKRTQVIMGFQYWFYNRCRIQLQYTYANSWTQGLNTTWVDKNCNRLQMQTQVFF